MSERENTESASDHLETLRASGQLSEADYTKLREAMRASARNKTTAPPALPPLPRRKRIPWGPMVIGVVAGALCLLMVLGYVWRNRDGAAVPVVIWDMSASGLLDETNRLYTIENKTVHVWPLTKPDKCPAGLGNIAEGKPDVNTIVITYDVARSGTYYLHIEWNPGGSGEERFEVLNNGQLIRKSEARHGEGNASNTTDIFEVPHRKGTNVLTLHRLSGDGMHFLGVALTSVRDLDTARQQTSNETPSAAASQPSDPQAEPSQSETPAAQPTKPAVQTMKPDLKHPDVGSYSAAIGAQGMVLTSEHILFFAPQAASYSAQIIFPYLVKAYDELKAITGVDTKYKIVVYHFAPGNADAFGGTSECVIYYDYGNLYIDQFPEWTQHHVPHVSGYIEEMAHNFVGTTNVQFGWEMVGWSLGIAASRKVADNPIFEASLRQTRAGQADTYQRYMTAGCVLPPDVDPNQVDRIHAYILGQCEQRYGARFWPDFFKEVRKQHEALEQALSLPDDENRNARYQISVECFDRLPGLDFKKMLQSSGISLTTDVKALHPTEPGWNRQLQ